MLQCRAAILRQVRAFFDNKNYLELDTPLLCDNLIPESCLEVFQTERLFPHGSRKEKQSLWLIPSPEIWMKKIIAQHKESVYQICKSFRNGESEGRLHNSEFTMLEYYTMEADYMDSLALTEQMIEHLFKNPAPGVSAADKEKWKIEHITVAGAFEKWAGFKLLDAAYEGEEIFTSHARRLGLEPLPGMTVPQLYDLIFIHAVEPHLKIEKAIALLDYPAFVPCLARKSKDGKTVERWELYYNGIELANCFSEETDPQKIKDFFISEEEEKERTAIVQHKVDHDYWKMFDSKTGYGFPRCSGVAMGLDRLIMALTGKSNIDCVLATSNTRTEIKT